MVVGICRISLSLPGIDSLKAKRSIVRPLLARTANKFNVAVAEVADQDTHRVAVLGFAVVSGNRRHADSMLESVASFVEASADAIVTDRSTELISLGTVGDWTA